MRIDFETSLEIKRRRLVTVVAIDQVEHGRRRRHGEVGEHTKDKIVEVKWEESGRIICRLGSEDAPAARPRVQGFSRVRQGDRVRFRVRVCYPQTSHGNFPYMPSFPAIFSQPQGMSTACHRLRPTRFLWLC